MTESEKPEFEIQLWPDGCSGHISYRDKNVHGDFYMEMNAGPSPMVYSIHFPYRKFDKYALKVKENISTWLKENDHKIDIIWYGGNHNLYSGFTVNERLFISGLMEDFELACKEKNVHNIKDFLEELEVDENSINSIVKKKVG